MSGRAPARRTERRLQPRELAADNARLHPTLRAALREDARWYAVYRGERFEFGSPLGELANLVRLLFVADDFPPLVLYRLRTALAHARVPLAPWLLHRLCIALWDVRIGPHVVLGPGAYIPHGNVVIDGVTRIGPHAVLAPWVTVGCVQGDHVGPRIGENVFVSTHASVLGDIEVGSHSTIAASAVVTSDVPPHALAAGVPARVVRSGPPVTSGRATAALDDAQPQQPSPAEFRAIMRRHLRQRPGLRAVAADLRATARAHGAASGQRRIAAPGFVCVALYRLRVTLLRWHVPVAPWLLHRASMALFNVRIGELVSVEGGLALPQGNVVIDGITRIGRDATIGPRVTIGLRRNVFIGPHIGDGVTVGPRASITGSIRVGDGATVLPGAAVSSDVPAGARVAGAPARVVEDGTP